MSMKQVVGTEQLLQHSGTGTPSSDPRGGMKQTVGTRLPLSETSNQSPSSNPVGGMKQVVGTAAEINKSPVKGWPEPGMRTPMSPRAVKQSDTVGGRGTFKASNR